MGGELLTALGMKGWGMSGRKASSDLVILLQFLVVDIPNLAEFCLIVTVLNGSFWRECCKGVEVSSTESRGGEEQEVSDTWGGDGGRLPRGSAALVRTRHSLGDGLCPVYSV